MRRTGNTAANKTYNPQNAKPAMPLDVDEVDGVLERFIRQKYDQQVFNGTNPRPAVRHNTGNTSSTRSSEDQPPPLPPKPSKRFGFGFRSASSVIPGGLSKPMTSPRSPDDFRRPSSPIRTNKQSRVFGASVGGNGDDIEGKLAQLRDMGFADEKRNLNILKGHGGNVERAIESLVRLGEGSGPNSRSRTPLQPRSTAGSQPSQSSHSTGMTSGISIASDPPAPPSNAVPNAPASAQTSKSNAVPTQRSFSPSNPYQTSSPQPYNPFNAPIQQPHQPIEQAFQNMQISPQPLFPHATGGYPNQPPPIQDPRAQTMTPPLQQQIPQYDQSSQITQIMQSPNNSYNPFMNPNTQQNQPVQANPYQQTQIPPQSYNPFQQPQPQTQPQVAPAPQTNGYSATASPFNPFDVQQGSQQQPMAYQNSFSAVQSPPQNTTPFSLPQHSYTEPNQYQPQYQQLQPTYQTQPQPLLPQQTGRVDKSSILALYNHPHLAPPPLPTETALASGQTQPPFQTSNPSELAPGPALRQGQRSVTMPVQLSSSSNNPFQSRAPVPQTNGLGSGAGVGMGVGGPSRHISQESVDVGGYQNGRHSPDAFASLSARFVR